MGEVTRKVLGDLRGGMSAGNKDTKAVGEHRTDAVGLSDVAKFTPYNCNFFKVTISKEENEQLLNKDRDFTEKLTRSDKCNPLYDRKRFREFLRCESKQKL